MAKAKSKKGATSKMQLIEAAIQLISENGYGNTSLQMIAKECNQSQGAPLYHFKNKFGLFAAIITHVSSLQEELLEESLEKRDDGFNKLMKLILSYMNLATFYRSKAQMFLLLYHFAAVNAEFRKFQADHAYQEVQMIEKYLIVGKAEGLFKINDSDLNRVARSIYNLAVGAFVNFLVVDPRSLNFRNFTYEIESTVKKLVEYNVKN